MPDKKLIKRIVAGNTRLYTDLIRRHKPGLLDLCTTLVGRTYAEKAVRDVCAKAFLRLKYFRSESSVSTWLYRIAKNHCHDQLRRRRRTAVAFARTFIAAERSRRASAAPLATPEEITARLSTMPAQYRLILMLREVNGYSYARIMEETHCSLDSVKSRLRRARALLRHNDKDKTLARGNGHARV